MILLKWDVRTCLWSTWPYLHNPDSSWKHSSFFIISPFSPMDITSSPKMITDSPLVVRLKRYHKYGDRLICVFTIWDITKNKIIVRNKKHHKIVNLLHFIHFLSICTQLYCTRTRATNLLDTVEAIGFTMIMLACFLMKSTPHPDLNQISLLNYICKLVNS